ncbi:FKBP-type peptidyl-prolyl cis-trans isomerase [Pedobacter sp. SYSU D00535]|uniref:FKBP-type peptidyl-prolyl cis-trans isomerase n=1 Tax=Pedobacter sp. SYSU D00535 TaxID=2810308 RepID=UPI001A95E65A|nr:FKBP-type peptidyl-prolyl cis-trans isomerase [Pedobacter sp. SYSU D00535]
MKFKRYTLPALLLAAIVFFAACKKDYASIEEEDQQGIDAYMSQNSLTGFTLSNGIYYKVIKQGTGEELDYTKRVLAHYTVRSLDGRFSAVDTITLYNRFYNFFGYISLPGVREKQADAFREVINEGLTRVGGEIRLVIPSRFAYGVSGYSSFPGYDNSLDLKGNSSLDVTVKIVASENTIAQYEEAVIKNHLGASINEFTKTASGLYYKIINPGTGSPITRDSTVMAIYTGKFTNGKVFASNDASNLLEADLDGGVVKGWTEGLPFIKEGGSIRVVFPSSLGYGNGIDRGFPPFVPLDFEIRVTEVKP